MTDEEKQASETSPLIAETSTKVEDQVDEIIEEKSGKVTYNSGLLIICMVAFTNGVIGLADLSIQYMFKDDFGMSPAAMSMATSVISFPWIIKPIWGFISDTYPIFGYKRKIYLGTFGLIGALGYLVLAFLVNAVWNAILCLIIIQTAISFCNVIGEALIVEEAQKSGGSQELASKYVSIFFAMRVCGTIVTAYTSGAVLMFIDKQIVFTITAVFPLLLCFSSLIFKEERYQYNPDTLNLVTQIKEIKKFVSKREVALPVIFMFLIWAMPTAADAMFYFMTNELAYTPEFMGRLKLTMGFASLIAILFYNRYLHDAPFNKLFVVTTMFAMVFEGADIILVRRLNHNLHIPDQYFSLVNGFNFQTVIEINSMPLLVLAARMCPKNLEASLYALLMSTMNFGQLISFQLGSLGMLILGISKTNFHNLWALNLISTLAYLIPLPLLWHIKTDECATPLKDGYDLVQNNEFQESKHYKMATWTDWINVIRLMSYAFCLITFFVLDGLEKDEWPTLMWINMFMVVLSYWAALWFWNRHVNMQQDMLFRWFWKAMTVLALAVYLGVNCIFSKTIAEPTSWKYFTDWFAMTVSIVINIHCYIDILFQCVVIYKIHKTERRMVLIHDGWGHHSRPPRNPGLSYEEIEMLPDATKLLDTECSIWLEPLGSEDLSKQLPWEHQYHLRCVAEWFKDKTTCPVCRQSAKN